MPLLTELQLVDDHFYKDAAPLGRRRVTDLRSV